MTQIAVYRDLRVVPLTRELDRQLFEREQWTLPEGAEPAVNDPAARRCNDFAFALLRGDAVLAEGGLIPLWPGRAEAWLLVGRDTSRRDLVPALRHARTIIEGCQRNPDFRRVEIHIRWEMPWRDSFARALGMSLEAQLRAASPTGGDMAIYARVV
jgi:hypothetical protein